MKPLALTVAGLVALAVGPALAQSGTPIAVPSDPRARYAELARRPIGPGRVEITTRRAGPADVSYSIREYDCRAMTFRYLGTGDTLAEAERRATAPGPMAPLFNGSISWHVGTHACRGVR